jgi:hypothetical protein
MCISNDPVRCCLEYEVWCLEYEGCLTEQFRVPPIGAGCNRTTELFAPCNLVAEECLAFLLWHI